MGESDRGYDRSRQNYLAGLVVPEGKRNEYIDKARKFPFLLMRPEEVEMIIKLGFNRTPDESVFAVVCFLQSSGVDKNTIQQYQLTEMKALYAFAYIREVGSLALVDEALVRATSEADIQLWTNKREEALKQLYFTENYFDQNPDYAVLKALGFNKKARKEFRLSPKEKKDVWGLIDTAMALRAKEAITQEKPLIPALEDPMVSALQEPLSEDEAVSLHTQMTGVIARMREDAQQRGVETKYTFVDKFIDTTNQLQVRPGSEQDNKIYRRLAELIDIWQVPELMALYKKIQKNQPLPATIEDFFSVINPSILPFWRFRQVDISPDAVSSFQKGIGGFIEDKTLFYAVMQILEVMQQTMIDYSDKNMVKKRLKMTKGTSTPIEGRDELMALGLHIVMKTYLHPDTERLFIRALSPHCD